MSAASHCQRCAHAATSHPNVGHETYRMERDCDCPAYVPRPAVDVRSLAARVRKAAG
jgi:hypothetical protein